MYVCCISGAQRLLQLVAHILSIPRRAYDVAEVPDDNTVAKRSLISLLWLEGDRPAEKP